MMRSFFTMLVFVLLSGLGIVRIAAQFPDAHELPPPGWTGNVFQLSQAYPELMPSPEMYPWEEIDFKTDPSGYMNAVLEYVYEGNLAIDFKVQDNEVRKWYHAPWMHWGPSGREFIHGMTRERTSRPFELAPTQSTRFQNWAVGFYNPPGGYSTGQVWKDPEAPDASQAIFPVGTVSAKLLFTAATVEQVPFLANAFEWQANANKETVPTEREPQTLRLLQLDVAIRDDRADDTTGWVFGTFVYNDDHEGDTPFEKMRPVGLMWGNDPTATPASVATTPLVESWINPGVTQLHYGYAGRLNGPVDNPLSSCLSCHATAQIPSSSPMIFPPSTSESERLRWFRNIAAGETFDPGTVSTDYSLQLAFGIINFKQSKSTNFAAIANSMAQAWASKDIAASREFTKKLDTQKEVLDRPMMLDGQLYFPISRGD